MEDKMVEAAGVDELTLVPVAPPAALSMERILLGGGDATTRSLRPRRTSTASRSAYSHELRLKPLHLLDCQNF